VLELRKTGSECGGSLTPWMAGSSQAMTM